MANPDDEGLSLWYRFGWRVRYALNGIFGPAQLDSTEDPQSQLRTERAAKVAASRDARLEAEARKRDPS